MERFFINFSRLAIRFVELDTNITLSTVGTATDLVLFSTPYIRELDELLSARNTSLYDILWNQQGSKIIEFVTRIVYHLVEPGFDIIQKLHDLAQALATDLQKKPAFGPQYVDLLRIVQKLLIYICNQREGHELDPDTTANMQKTRRQSLQFCQDFDLILQRSISKQWSWLTNETIGEINDLFSVSLEFLVSFDSSVASSLLSDEATNSEDLTANEVAQIAVHDWKLNLCWRAITTGRMEIRAQGIEMMQLQLVWIYHHFIKQREPADSPLVRHVVRWLRHSKILQYLFGADSHAQLISRSGNVIAFLAVSNAYTDEDTDVIWNCILENRDSRMVNEMLLPMTTLLEYLNASAIGYIFTKLFELPVSRFEPRIIEFCTHLLGVVDRSWETHKEYIPAVLEFRLFIHILRSDSAAGDIALDIRANLQRWAFGNLTRLSEAVMDSPDIDDILGECIVDVKQMNASSSGSIRAIQALTSPAPKAWVLKLSDKFDYPRTLIEALSRSIESFPERFTNIAYLQNDYIIRIQTLANFICYAPDQIDEDLTDSLWSHVYGSSKIGQSPRRYAWEMLSTIVERCSSRNTFIDMFLAEYFPRLAPREYDMSTLQFVSNSLGYEIRDLTSPSLTMDSILSLTAPERLWRLVLYALPDTVRNGAIDSLITFYLDSSTVLQCPAEVVKAVHISLVDRCIQQIIGAATTLRSFNDEATASEDEPMILVASQDEIKDQELRFTRSLLFLRQFLNRLKDNKRFSPPPDNEAIQASPMDTKGEKVVVKYQAFDGKGDTGIQSVSIGNLNTAHDLALVLRRRTGIPRFAAYKRGSQIDLFENYSTLQDLKIGGLAGLLVLNHHQGRRGSFTHVDCEIVKNFDHIYALLELDLHLAAEIFNFLQVFPVQRRVHELIRRQDARAEDVLPLDRPYKLLYSANAIFLALEDESLSSAPNVDFVRHCVGMLVSVCEAHNTQDITETIQCMISANLIDCLLLALRVKVTSEMSTRYFPNPTLIVQYLGKVIDTLLKQPQKASFGPATRPLPCQAFAVLIEGSMHNVQMWTELERQLDPTILLSSLLLRSTNEIRKGTADVLFGLSGPPSTKMYFKPHSSSAVRLRFPKDAVQALVHRLWPKLNVLLPETIRSPGTAHDTFEVVLAFYRLVGPSQDVEGFIKDCCRLLAEYKPSQIVGQQNDDHVLLGLVRLVSQAIEFLKTSGRFVEQTSLLKLLMSKYLFPRLSEESSDKTLSPTLPVLKSSLRQDLYSLALRLQTDRNVLNVILDSMNDLWEPNTWDAPVQNERFPLRSEMGHAGLRNLSNTCYLNSLFSQLYMNLEFREFLFSIEPAYQVIGRLRNVYAQMQNSCLRAVDTSEVVQSIRTYDNEAIDIAVQMDVDEFYNLLFDRLEAQMPSREAKSKFRSIYGGQLVQQIKSKECEHISERLEPFSAIQCEIRGKGSLEESLKAYVEGEVMQGDNKYSCTGCGRHVNAVKRACLKHVPDHLIFHLKRFDFDINTMTRCKINDEFAFPHSIDMAPYTVESLNNEEEDVTPDTFELVGVLIHSGTAESGHYYSLVRERPTNKDTKASWIQFNDSEVTFIEQDRLRDYCFGGLDPSAFRAPKVWSAYMLFYQRVSSIESFKLKYPTGPSYEPVRLQLPVALENEIVLQNERYLQASCAQDPVHARFMLSILDGVKHVDGGEIPGGHGLETKTIRLVLQYIEQVSSRFKELPDVEPSFKLLSQYVTDCHSCANDVLNYFFKNPESFRASVMRNPQPAVRSSFATLIWKSLRALQKVTKSRTLSSSEAAHESRRYRELVKGVLTMIDEEWDEIHQVPRGWDDYFYLLSRIATLGDMETGKILERNYLLRCLSMIWIDSPEDIMKIRNHYPGLWKSKSRGRKFSYEGLMELFARLLEHIDYESPQTEDHARYSGSHGFTISRSEMRLFKPGAGENGMMVFHWLNQCLYENYNLVANASILKTLSERKYAGCVFNTIREGLDQEPASVAIPFLHATLVLGQHSRDRHKVNNLMHKALASVDTIGNSAGLEHVNFVRSVADLENASLSMIPEDFRDMLIKLADKWAPTLLMYRDHHVRSEALKLVQEHLLSPLEVGEDQLVDEEVRSALEPQARALAEAIHLRINGLARDRQIGGNERHGRLSRSLFTEALQVMEFIYEVFSQSENNVWKDIRGESDPSTLSD